MKHPIYTFIVLLLALLAFLSACSTATSPPKTFPSAAPISTTPPSTTPLPTASPSLTATFTASPTLTELPATDTATPSMTPTEIPIFWDDFSEELQPGWSWIRENDALWSLTSEPGYLRIVLQGDRPPRNLLVREVSSDNFQIMTHVLFTPTSNFQFAGLLVYQDDDTLAAFGRAYCDTKNDCVGNGIYFDAYQDGQFLGSNFATDTQAKDEAYLRIEKNGSLFKGYYSEDGVNWIWFGEHEIFMIDPKVGLITGNSKVVGMIAMFDYFTVMEMP